MGFCNASIYLKDSFEYLNQAKNITSGNGWYSGDIHQTFNNDMVSQRPPLYSFFILIFKSIIQSDHFILLIQCFISVFIFTLVYKLYQKFGKETPSPFIFSLLIFFPTQFIYSNMIMSELLCQATVFLSFYFMIIFLIDHKQRNLFLFFLFISLAILTKPVWYLFWIPALFFMIYLFYKRIIPIYSFIYTLIPIATVFLICLHNCNQTGYFHYSSVKRTNMVNYNVYLTLAQKYSPDSANTILAAINKTALTKGSYKNFAQYIEDENTRIIKENLPTYLWLETKGIFNFFTDHGRFDMYSFFSLPPEENMNGLYWFYSHYGIKGVQQYLSQFPIGLIIYLPIIVLVNFFITLCFLLFLFNRKISLEVRLTAILFIFYLAIITGPIGAARFRMPVYPILLFTLPFGYDILKEKLTRKSNNK
jgi:dolichyl-phosphate-mannose-protein mannosyltransferase